MADMTSQQLYAMQAGAETGQAIGAALQAQVFHELQAGSIQRQMDELAIRNRNNQQQIYKGAEKVQSQQQAAYTAGGVDVSGSAMSVISDTLSNAAQAAYIQQREYDYNRENMGLKQSIEENAGSDMNTFLSIAAAGVSGTAKYQASQYEYNKMNKRNTGASGLGSTVSDTTTSYNKYENYA